MDEDLLTKQKGLGLSEREAKVVGVESVLEGDGEKEGMFCIVGSLITKKSFNPTALGNTMVKSWNPNYKVDFRMTHEKVMLFEFESLKDRDRVLKGGPWSFDKGLFLIEPYDGSQRPSDIEFHYVSFWIRVLDLPVNLMTRDVAISVGKMFGNFVEADFDKRGKVRSQRLRIKVTIAVRDSLQRGIFLFDKRTRQTHWYFVKYERLSNFCYCYGKLGHLYESCNVYNDEEVEDLSFGEWLRASSDLQGQRDRFCNNEKSNTEDVTANVNAAVSSGDLQRSNTAEEGRVETTWRQENGLANESKDRQQIWGLNGTVSDKTLSVSAVAQSSVAPAKISSPPSGSSVDNARKEGSRELIKVPKN